MGLLSERTHGDFICRMFQCLCTNFVTSACCIEYIACILRVEGGAKLLFIVHCSLFGWEVMPLMHFYTVHICIYWLYCHVMNTDCVIFARFAFLQKKLVHAGGFFFFFFQIENMRVILVCFFSWSSSFNGSWSNERVFGGAPGSTSVFACELPSCWLEGGRGESKASFAFKACSVPRENPYMYNYSLCILSNSAWFFFFNFFFLCLLGGTIHNCQNLKH